MRLRRSASVESNPGSKTGIHVVFSSPEAPKKGSKGPSSHINDEYLRAAQLLERMPKKKEWVKKPVYLKQISLI
jgi:hypothetical protein